MDDATFAALLGAAWTGTFGRMSVTLTDAGTPDVTWMVEPSSSGVYIGRSKDGNWDVVAPDDAGECRVLDTFEEPANAIVYSVQHEAQIRALRAMYPEARTTPDPAPTYVPPGPLPLPSAFVVGTQNILGNYYTSGPVAARLRSAYADAGRKDRVTVNPLGERLVEITDTSGRLMHIRLDVNDGCGWCTVHQIGLAGTATGIAVDDLAQMGT